jgi:hypothetical protein
MRAGLAIINRTAPTTKRSAMPRSTRAGYADQAERDHAALKAAINAGTIKVHIEDGR